MSLSNNEVSVGFIGGDMRIYMLADIMKKNGYKVKAFMSADIYGSNNCEIAASLNDLFSSCDVIVLPVPVSRDKATVFTDHPEISVKLSDVVSESSKHGAKVIFGGIIPSVLRAELEKNGHKVIDFFDNQVLIINNAIATAEGALMIAMEKTPTTIISSSFAILGFGRIASHLAKILTSLGGRVTVLARRNEVIEEAQRRGYTTMKLEETLSDSYAFNLARVFDSVSVIFNTVPSVIIDRRIIEKMHARPLYVELASFPYGIDSKDAREMDFNTVYAPSLPGRYSPRSAAEYIFEAISYYLTQIEG